MTRKHFEAVARAVRAIEDRERKEIVCRELCALLPTCNRAFDEKKFRAACDVPATEDK